MLVRRLLVMSQRTALLVSLFPPKLKGVLVPLNPGSPVGSCCFSLPAGPGSGPGSFPLLCSSFLSPCLALGGAHTV